MYTMEKLSKKLFNGLKTYCRYKTQRLTNKRYYVTTSSYRWEPPGLKTEPDIPEYKDINIKLLSYDYPVLEHFTKYVMANTKRFGTIVNSWAVPSTKMEINTLQFKKSTILESFTLQEYQRIVQITDIPSFKLPILLEVLKVNCPIGLKIELAENTEEDHEFLYVPDYEKQKFEEELEMLDERKKWI